MLLYRPVGLNELRLMYQADLRGFPPRLPDQPIFYPVLNEPYAIKIARDWNTKSETHVGFVTRFSVDDTHASRYQRQVVGSRDHEELWVPAEELADFNAHLEAPIQIVGAFYGDGFVGEVPEQGALGGKNAREQLVTLAALVGAGSLDLAGEIEVNHQAVFLGFDYWERNDFTSSAVGTETRDRALAVIRQAWARTRRGHLPLGVSRG